MKNIIQIETIQEGECEYESEETYGNKIEYYKINHENDDNNEMDDNKEMDDGDTASDVIKKKIQYLITYALTTTFSIALIILTFSI